MTSQVESTLAIAQLQERLRQERETFNQKKSQDQKWFVVRIAMACIAVVLLPAIAVVSGYVLLNPGGLPDAVLLSAGGAFFVDALGLVIAIWKLVMGTGPGELAPVTEIPE